MHTTVAESLHNYTLLTVWSTLTSKLAVSIYLCVLMLSIVIVIIALMDDTIHDDEYIQKTYDYPILAKIPDLLEEHSSGSKDYYYSGYYKEPSKTAASAEGGK